MESACARCRQKLKLALDLLRSLTMAGCSCLEMNRIPSNRNTLIPLGANFLCPTIGVSKAHIPQTLPAVRVICLEASLGIASTSIILQRMLPRKPISTLKASIIEAMYMSMAITLAIALMVIPRLCMILRLISKMATM